MQTWYINWPVRTYNSDGFYVPVYFDLLQFPGKPDNPRFQIRI